MSCSRDVLISKLCSSCLRQASSVLSHWITEYIHVLRITSCNSPFRLTFGHSNLLQANLVVRSNSLPANLSNLLSVLICPLISRKRSSTSAFIFGWAGRIRTSACQDQNLVPYRLATAQYNFNLNYQPSFPGIRHHVRIP